MFSRDCKNVVMWREDVYARLGIFVCMVFDDFCKWPSSKFLCPFISLLLNIVILFPKLCISLLSYCWSGKFGFYLCYEDVRCWQPETVISVGYSSQEGLLVRF